MKPDYVYLIVSADGSCRRVGDQAASSVDLGTLLGEGWLPLRETTFGDGSVLVVLERGGGEKFGFGFGST